MSTQDDATPASPVVDALDRVVRLDHFLKREGLVDTGGGAKQAIQGGLVFVNGAQETRRKRKLRAGDVVRVGGRDVTVSEADVAPNPSTPLSQQPR